MTMENLPQKLVIVLEALIFLFPPKTCNSSETIDITAIAKFPQKLAIARETMPWSLKTTPNKNYTNTICMFEVHLMNKMHRKRIFIF